jgi:hypothetical protein
MSHATPSAHPLTYEVAPPPPRRFSWLIFFCTACVVGFVAILLSFVAPQMESIYRDFKIELPAPTRAFLMLGRLFGDWGWIPAFFLPPALAIIVPALKPRPRTWDAADYAHAFNRLLGMMVVVLSILILIIVTYIVLMLPMITLIQGISSRASPPPTATPVVNPSGS